MAAHLSNILLWSCLHPYIMECTQKASVTVHLLYHEQVRVLFSVQQCLTIFALHTCIMMTHSWYVLILCVRACVCVCGWVDGCLVYTTYCSGSWRVFALLAAVIIR